MAQFRRWHSRRLPHLFGVAIRSIGCSSLLLMALYLWVENQGLTEPIELVIVDYWAAHQTQAKPDPRFLIVTITEADIRQQGWPISNDQLAEVLARIQDHQPRVVGLDLYRNLPSTATHQALARQLQAPNLIAIEEIVNDIPPPPHVPPERVGFNDFTLDHDGVIRRLLLFVGASEQSYASFALRVSLAYLGEAAEFDHDGDRLWINGVPFPRLTPQVGGYQQADTRGYQILFNYHSHQNFAPTISLTSVLAGELTAEQVRDKIVLIGSVAPSLKDLFLTPYSRYTETLQLPGVMIHGQGVRQVVAVALGEERLFRFWPHWGEWLWLGVWTMIGGAIAWQMRHPLILGGIVLCGSGVIVGTAGLLWQSQVWVPLVAPLLAFAIAVVLAMAHRLLYTTNRDSLTGLPNQRSFISQLTPRRGQKMAKTVIFLELDRFSWIRNSIGEGAGDQLLQQVVSRLQTTLPGRAMLARLGGDGLAIALSQTDRESLMAVAEQCQATLSRPINLTPNQPISLTATLGIAIPEPHHIHHPENLLRDAQTAMYRARSQGLGHCQIFATGMLTASLNQFNLEQEMRQGIEAEEFVLYYQPIIHLQTGAITGFEALIRWQHPQQGFISPGVFIPLAEETGLIIPLGDWICQAAIAQVHQWQQQFPHRPLTVSINLSGRQFEQADFGDKLTQFISRSGVDPQGVKLEITESIVMGNVEAAIDLMLRIKALGCKISLDDFGTGYSSLSQLRRLPLDTLKVDQSFVRTMGDSREDLAIVEMVINLSHILGMEVIAEGVETEADATLLRSLHCDFGQGYLWDKPLPATVATTRLEQDGG